MWHKAQVTNTWDADETTVMYKETEILKCREVNIVETIEVWNKMMYDEPLSECSAEQMNGR